MKTDVLPPNPDLFIFGLQTVPPSQPDPVFVMLILLSCTRPPQTVLNLGPAAG